MICEAYLSTKLTGLSNQELSSIVEYLIRIFGHQRIDQFNFEQIIQLIYQDKKNTGKVINGSLLKAIGDCAINIPLGEPDIVDSLFFYNNLADRTTR